MCIPKITHHRCKLFEVYKQFDDGADYFAISKDIYPDLFLLRYPHIVKKAPGNRFLEKHGKSTKYLWFPSETLSPKEIEEIRGWAERFKRYVLLNEGKLAKHYSSELDFCMALDFNYDENHTRTPVGELVYNIKYQHKNGDHLKELVKMVETGISDLPLQGFSKESIVITCVPGESTEKLPHKIVEKLKASKKWDCRPCTITEGKKPKSKELALCEKIAQYDKFYSEMSAPEKLFQGKNIVVVDDLYQSGTTIWSYAKYLKSLGANTVLGLACEKGWHDDDNKRK